MSASLSLIPARPEIASPPSHSDFSSTTLYPHSGLSPTKLNKIDENSHHLEEGYPQIPPAEARGSALLRSRKSFEPIDWSNFILLTVVLGGCWPFGRYTPGPWTMGQSIGWARVYVGLIGIVIGVSTGYVLLFRVGKKVYNAVVFSTLVESDVALHELDRFAEVGPISALNLLRFRMTSKQVRRSNDRRPWSIFILYFLLLVALAQAGSFLYGRTVSISPVTQPQSEEYYVLPVLGSLSGSDIQYAKDLASFFTDGSRWTVASLAALITPSTANLPFTSPRTGNTTSVTFTEASSLYFSSEPTAVGPAASLWKAFESQTSYGRSTENVTQDATLGKRAQGTDSGKSGGRPVSVEYPLWGSRVACATIRQGPTPGLIQMSASTNKSSISIPDIFMGVPNGTIQELLAEVDADAALAGSPLLFQSVIDPRVSDLPVGDVIIGPWSDDGVAMSFNSLLLDNGTTGYGATAIDFIIVRLNTSFINSSSTASLTNEFQSYVTSSDSTIGIDGAVCVTKVSPYLVRAIDLGGLVSLTDIIAEANGINKSPSPPGRELGSLLSLEAAEGLNSTGSEAVFTNAFLNSRNQLKKDNGRDQPYVPNPSLVQMSKINTRAIIPTLAYGTLDATACETVLRSTNSRFWTWYLVGQQRIRGHAYIHKTLAAIHVDILWFSILIGALYLLGLIGIMCVPRLPLDLPAQDTNVSTWLSTFSDQVRNTSFSRPSDGPPAPITIRYRDPSHQVM
ncbi:hypothetical protein CROQUDRAFT_42548 [Cronartium quercuum f. sp. fusiforme G11]|uniref:Uncharacterized protein n=1 Tax=Cronartium quercuum f. sp. fusiforme G11 TaxID=708437 RepID=A0A9P6TDG1_9BASI|nr:hypothetical protein CROQUDRAFT_42548 [Cronartium quercuum f. sp. fusiforme G11]